VALKRVRLIRPWIGLERSDDGAIPTLRLLNELRGTDAGRAEGGGAQAIVTAETLTVEDGTAEIVDRSVQPPFRDRLDELAMTVEGLDGRGSRRMRIELTGVLSDRSTVGMRGSLLPLASQLYLDLEGDIRDFNVPRLNPYTERLTAHRVSQGKLYSRVRYRIEENRLRGENTVRIAQLALGDTPRGTEDRFQRRFGLPLDVVVALLQDASGEISLRVPVSGELDRPEFDLKEAVASAINNALVQVIAAPFSLIGQIVTLGGRLGAIAVDPVRFDPGSFALDGVARAHLDKVAVVMTERPRIAIRLSGWVHPASDEEGLRALRLEERIANLRRADGVASRDEAIDRLFARTFGEPGVGLDPARRLARLRAVERLEERDVAELSDARMLAVYDYLARAGIARERIFLGEGGSGETGRREGDDARRVDFSVLGAYHGDRAPIAVPDGRGTAGER
jgi:hypothetical protein